jgi:hypothetical protein
MKVHEILTEGLSRNKATSIISKFIEFATSELGLQELPNIEMQDGNDRSVEFRSFGGYGDKHITVTLSNRHIMDVCRTLAHELVHYRQDLNNELTHDSGNDGSDHENEANAQAAVIMRKWGKMHPNLFKQQAVE